MSDEIVVSQNGQESGFVDDDRESDIFEGDVISPKYTFLAVMNNNNRQNSKLTLNVIEEICEGIESGDTLHECCRKVKIHPYTLGRWRRLGDQNLADKKAELNEYGVLVEAMKMASGAWASRQIKLMQSHGQEDWRAVAWLLERMLPEQFGPHRTHSDPSKDGNFGNVINMRVNQELLDDL